MSQLYSTVITCIFPVIQGDFKDVSFIKDSIRAKMKLVNKGKVGL